MNHGRGGTVELIGIMKVERFTEGQPKAKGPMAAWVAIVEQAEWKNPHDVRAMLSHTDFIGKGLTVFNVGGNNYRISATVSYQPGKVVIRYVMTHADYTKRSARGAL